MKPDRVVRVRTLKAIDEKANDIACSTVRGIVLSFLDAQDREDAAKAEYLKRLAKRAAAVADNWRDDP